MIWFVFSQNYPGFWLENVLTVMGMVAVEYESRGLGVVQVRGKGSLDQCGDSDCGGNWRDSRCALEKWQNLQVLCGGVVRRGRCQGLESQVPGRSSEMDGGAAERGRTGRALLEKRS